MSRVITFSTKFPAFHPKAGEPTFFVQKILAGLLPGSLKPLTEIGTPPKFHTIRAGHRWKVGDKFSPRIWTGKPYQSKQEKICEDIEIVKTWDFEMIPALHWDECLFKSKDFTVDAETLHKIAANDGLRIIDFVQWFAGPGMMSSKRKPFHGQIICWNNKIEYGRLH